MTTTDTPATRNQATADACAKRPPASVESLIEAIRAAEALALAVASEPEQRDDAVAQARWTLARAGIGVTDATPLRVTADACAAAAQAAMNRAAYRLPREGMATFGIGYALHDTLTACRWLCRSLADLIGEPLDAGARTRHTGAPDIDEAEQTAEAIVAAAGAACGPLAAD